MNPDLRARSATDEVVPDGVAGRSKAERVQAMFARIVPRYDLMNAVMTGGMDRHWRREAVRAADPAGRIALDVGSGTGDLALALARAGAARVVGVDFCGEMLTAARAKTEATPHRDVLTFLLADAQRLPFSDCSFDRVVNGFLLRNVSDLTGALAEMARVLRPGGALVCLEITHPPTALAPFFNLYFRQVVPLVGAAVTGEAAAYRYLPASLGPLPDVRHLASLLVEVGLRDVRYRRLGVGSVALHVAMK